MNHCSGAITPLIAAASMGMLELVQSLIKRGADPNARPVVDQTALYKAAEHGHIDVVKYLSPCTPKNILASCAWTPLHVAAVSGHYHVVGHLLEAGFDRDAQDEVGRTALAISVEAGKSEVIKLLLAKGAQDLADDKNNHALDYAVVICGEKNYEDIIRQLKSAGFKNMKYRSQVSMIRFRSHDWDFDRMALLSPLEIYLGIYKYIYILMHTESISTNCINLILQDTLIKPGIIYYI